MSGHNVGKKNFTPPLPGIETGSSGHPARSQLLYRLSWGRSGSQEKFHILWNPKNYNHVDDNSLLGHILSQMNSIHTITPYFFKSRLILSTIHA
jgi:hypothetical protein